jgi:phage tail protein X
MSTTIKVAGNGITVELLLWRHGKRRGQTSERLAETLELNPGLAALGPILPLGTKVVIPDLPAPSKTTRTTAPAVSLFD